MLQPNDGAKGGELRQRVVLIGGTPLDQVLEMFDRQARVGDPLSAHLPEVWEWHYFLAVKRFLEQWRNLPAEQLEQLKVATGYAEYQQWLADPVAARREINQIREEFLAEFGPGAEG